MSTKRTLVNAKVLHLSQLTPPQQGSIRQGFSANSFGSPNRLGSDGA